MKKILIVEDDTSISEELKNLLENSGFNGVILKDFENSFEEIKKENPDLILLDINIPKLNGEMLLQKIRKESNVPIIMVTSKIPDMILLAFAKMSIPIRFNTKRIRTMAMDKALAENIGSSSWAYIPKASAKELFRIGITNLE